MKNKFSESRVESIMESLGGMQPAVAPDFFYTRLKGKMQPEEKKTSFLLRPAFITVALSLFLIVNVFSLLNMNKIKIQNFSVQKNEPESIESFAKAYDFNGSESVYE